MGLLGRKKDFTHIPVAQLQPGMFLIPASILRKAGGWDESLTLIDDFEFFSRVLCHANEVRFTPGAVLHYRSGLRGSLSGQKSRRAVESAFQSLTKGTGHLLACRADAEAKRSCANLFQDFIYTYYPDHKDLLSAMTARVDVMGGSDLAPDAPARFQNLRKALGWKLARRVQQLLKS